MTLPTREAIRSSDSVKTTCGLLKGAKQYMNTLTVKGTTGTPYYMIEPMENRTLEEEYPK